MARIAGRPAEAKAYLKEIPSSQRFVQVCAATGIVAIVTLSVVVLTGCESSQSIDGKAYADYAQGAFRASAEGYRIALESGKGTPPQEAALRYNLGTAQYRLNEHDGSVASFTQATAAASRDRSDGSAEIEFRALYNLGNTHFRRGDLEQAIAAYRQALGLNPGDEASKHNLELALEELQRRPDAGGPRDTERRQSTPEAGEGAPTPIPQTPVGLSAQEARRLLDMLGEDDLSTQRRRLQQMVPPRSDTDRDW